MTRWVSIPRLPAYRANIAVRKFEILPGLEPGSDKADATDWPRIVLQNTYGFISRIRTYDAIKQRAWVSPLWPLGNYKQLLLVFFLYGCCGIWTHEAEAWHLECHPFDRSGKQPSFFFLFVVTSFDLLDTWTLWSKAGFEPAKHNAADFESENN